MKQGGQELPHLWQLGASFEVWNHRGLPLDENASKRAASKLRANSVRKEAKSDALTLRYKTVVRFGVFCFLSWIPPSYTGPCNALQRHQERRRLLMQSWIRELGASSGSRSWPTVRSPNLWPQERSD